MGASLKRVGVNRAQSREQVLFVVKFLPGQGLIGGGGKDTAVDFHSELSRLGA